MAKVVSARRSIAEQTRLRTNLERRFTTQMMSFYEDEFERASEQLEPEPGIGQRLAKIYNPHIQSTIEEFAKRFSLVERKQEADFSYLIQLFNRQFGAQRVVNIEQSVANAIRRVVAVGLAEGFAERELAIYIQEQGKPKFQRYRAARIARTETHMAANFANHEMAKQINLPMQKQWVAVNDGRTRGWHSTMNGQTVGIDEAFDVPISSDATKGTVKMKYPGDPEGGPSNVINCRCVVIYLEPDDVLVEEETPVAQQPPQEQPARGSLGDFDTPVRRAELNDATTPLLSSRAATKAFNERLEENANDSRYEGFSFFKRRSKDDFGKFKISGLNERGASYLLALQDELDDLASRFGIPKLRGYKATGKRNVADMGDAIIGINAKYYNKYAASVGGKESAQTDILKIEKDLEKALNDQAALKTEYEKLADSFNRILDEGELMAFQGHDKKYFWRIKGTKDKLPEDDPRTIMLNDAVKAQKKLTTLNNKVKRLRGKLKDIQSIGLEDDFVPSNPRDLSSKELPHGVTSYFDNNFDQGRSVLYHEFGHHVHQSLGYKGKINRRESKPAIERAFLKNRGGDGWVVSQYSQTNSAEWFAENFSLYFMGKREYCDPRFIKFFNEEVKPYVQGS